MSKTTLIFDASRILCDSMSLKKKRTMKSKNTYNIGGFLEFMSILRDCYKRFPEATDSVIVWDGGVNPKRKELDQNYKKYNEYFIESQFLSEGDEELHSDYLKQKELIKSHTEGIIPNIEIEGLEREDIISMIIQNADSENVYIVINDDDESYVFLKENVHIYRPFENTLVYLKSYLINNREIDINYAIRDFCICGHTFDRMPGCCPGVAEKYIRPLLKLWSLKGASFLEMSERDLSEFCKENGLPYRKAYYNFDIDRCVLLLKLYNYPSTDLIDSSIKNEFSKYLQGSEIPDNLLELIINRIKEYSIISSEEFNSYKISYRYGN